MSAFSFESRGVRFSFSRSGCFGGIRFFLFPKPWIKILGELFALFFTLEKGRDMLFDAIFSENEQTALFLSCNAVINNSEDGEGIHNLNEWVYLRMQVCHCIQQD